MIVSGRRRVVREVVVVFDGLKSGRFAEEAEMMDRNGEWEEERDSCATVNEEQLTCERGYEPSTMPKPERRMGTRDMCEGWMVKVVYV